MNRRTILVIENDTDIQALTKFSLEMDGHWQVDLANCVKAGLSKAKSIIPDVILLDSSASNIDIGEIIIQLKSSKSTRNIPIILFTTKLLDSKQLKNLNSSVIGTIYKPFDSLTLSTNITNILKKKVQSITRIASHC
ncbi:MAG: response regulator [Cyanobacteria bacterium P01_A01_bin.40]